MASDFRGTEFVNFEPLGLQCEEPGCSAEAVRLCCNAEGDAGRTHWHGGIHHVDLTKEGRYYCKEHGLKHLKANLVRMEESYDN